MYILLIIVVSLQGLIIAFTSDFIPRLIYTLKYSPDHSLEGYVNYTLAYFSTSDFTLMQQTKFNSTESVDFCRYDGTDFSSHCKVYISILINNLFLNGEGIGI